LGIPATSTKTGFVEALNVLAVESFGLVTLYVDEICQIEKDFLDGIDIKVNWVGSLNKVDVIDYMITSAGEL
jgi:maleate cis-trans isomerase